MAKAMMAMMNGGQCVPKVELSSLGGAEYLLIYASTDKELRRYLVKTIRLINLPSAY